ncbi:3068_t:CDS:2, partial [Diversispora eburnea]
MSLNKDKEKRNNSQDEKNASISNLESAKCALGSLGVVGDAVQPYLPLFSTVTIIISEINNVYANAKYNKKICNSLMDRVNIAELSIRNLERRKKENEKNFRDEGYYLAFHRFIEVMKNIKQFIGNVSTLSGFKKYFHANSIKEKFESLTSEFEFAMNNLHFTTTLRNDDQRRIDQESLSSDLKEMEEFLSTIGENVIDSNQQVNTVLTEIRIIKNQLT